MRECVTLVGSYRYGYILVECYRAAASNRALRGPFGSGGECVLVCRKDGFQCSVGRRVHIVGALRVGALCVVPLYKVVAVVGFCQQIGRLFVFDYSVAWRYLTHQAVVHRCRYGVAYRLEVRFDSGVARLYGVCVWTGTFAVAPANKFVACGGRGFECNRGVEIVFAVGCGGRCFCRTCARGDACCYLVAQRFELGAQHGVFRCFYLVNIRISAPTIVPNIELITCFWNRIYSNLFAKVGLLELWIYAAAVGLVSHYCALYRVWFRCKGGGEGRRVRLYGVTAFGLLVAIGPLAPTIAIAGRSLYVEYCVVVVVARCWRYRAACARLDGDIVLQRTEVRHKGGVVLYLHRVFDGVLGLRCIVVPVVEHIALFCRGGNFYL